MAGSSRDPCDRAPKCRCASAARAWVDDLARRQRRRRRARRPGRLQRDLCRRPGRHRQSAGDPAQHTALSNTAAGGFAIRAARNGFLQQTASTDAHAEPCGEVRRIEMDFGAANTNTTSTTMPASRTATSRASAKVCDPRRIADGPNQRHLCRQRRRPRTARFRRHHRIDRPRSLAADPVHLSAAYSMSLAAAIEPGCRFAGPFGGFQTDTNGIPTASNCAALTQAALTTHSPRRRPSRQPTRRPTSAPSSGARFLQCRAKPGARLHAVAHRAALGHADRHGGARHHRMTANT